MILRAVVLMLGALAAGCASAPDVPPRPAYLNHVVFIRLVDPADRAELIRDCDALAAAVPGVVSAFAGEHYDIGRAAVDKDYDVCFYVGFASEADYRAYLAHPVHTELVERWRPRTAWMRIHDAADPTP